MRCVGSLNKTGNIILRKKRRLVRRLASVISIAWNAAVTGDFSPSR
jgi:hypothetical protein